MKKTVILTFIRLFGIALTLTVLFSCSALSALSDLKDSSDKKKSKTEPFTLKSPAGADGATLDPKYTGFSVDSFPGLNWGTPPEGTKDIVLVMEDVTIHMVHWMFAVEDPSSTGLTAAQLKTVQNKLPPGPKREDYATIDAYNAAWNKYQGDVIIPLPTAQNRFKHYMPPMPDAGPAVHDYEFTIFALDKRWNPDTEKFSGLDGTIAARARKVLEGHILDSHTLTLKAERQNPF